MDLFNNRFAVGFAAGRLVKEFPMLTKLWNWLMDPKSPGRKRGLAVMFFCVACDAAVRSTCCSRRCARRALIVGSACALHVALYATWFDVAYQGVQTYLVPGATLTGVIVGVWGLIHATQRDHLVYPMAK
jgi:hypothetical protein